MSGKRECTVLQQSRLAKRRMTSLMAMGWKPPVFFWRAIKEAPTNHGAARKSNLPANITFKKEVSSDKQTEAEGVVRPEVISRRCWTCKLQPPGLVPRGKLFKEKQTACWSTVREGEIIWPSGVTKRGWVGWRHLERQHYQTEHNQ